MAENATTERVAMLKWIGVVSNELCLFFNYSFKFLNECPLDREHSLKTCLSLLANQLAPLVFDAIKNVVSIELITRKLKEDDKEVSYGVLALLSKLVFLKSKLDHLFEVFAKEETAGSHQTPLTNFWTIMTQYHDLYWNEDLIAA
jgi:hypothetical protein